MNDIGSHRSLPRTTQAAEGLPRWRWTTAELERMTALGVFSSEDRFELVGGEIVPMSPKGRRHEIVADELHRFWIGRVPADVWVSTERQFNLADDTYTDPDLLVRPSSIKVPDVRGDTALLVVEVAETSLGYDRGRMSEIYASFGVREYWVIDARTLETHIYRGPTAAGYASNISHAATELITPLLAPSLAVRLADLDLD